ncbi:MAG TPA: hypothetical protein VIA62_15530 [Thermoanaerobaculia bacterium]|nr:hypothetical protein [Thermoanaerobaculia bacterium]
MIVLLAFCLASSGAIAKPARSNPQPGALETLTGPMDVDVKGQRVVVKMSAAAGERWFRVATSGPAPLPSSFSADSAEAFYWQGHLLLLVPRDRKAIQFSMPGFMPARVPAPAEGSGEVRSVSDLDTLLVGYEVTRIDTATEIISAQGPRALLVIEERKPSPKQFTPPPNPGGGLGTCGSSCSITCGDGSTCSATCTSPRCASCNCPASCSCS